MRIKYRTVGDKVLIPVKRNVARRRRGVTASMLLGIDSNGELVPWSAVASSEVLIKRDCIAKPGYINVTDLYGNALVLATYRIDDDNTNESLEVALMSFDYISKDGYILCGLMPFKYNINKERVIQQIKWYYDI